VYQVENAAAVFAQHRLAQAHRRAQPRTGVWVNRTVLTLGLTSMFTDISAEMVTAVLPLYLVFGLHLSPLVFGAVDGLYAGATAPVRLLGGVLADRTRRHKQVAVAGYGLSSIARLGMVLVGSAWTGLAALVLLDRIGKGVRTAPRDAMISLATAPARWGAAFGVHRALDMAGAMAGPLLAFAVLAAAPGRYDAVFVVSLAAGLIGLGTLVVHVPRPRPAIDPAGRVVSLRAAAALLRMPRMATVTAATALLGLATVGDSFVYLVLQERLDLTIGLFPLLFVATSVAFMVLAVPIGRIADRYGRGPVLIGGYLALLAVYGFLLVPAGGASVVGAVIGLGAHYAATDGVLMALVGELLPAALRGSGMALVATGTSVARMAASLLFGLIWTLGGATAALEIFAVGLLVAMAGSAPMIIRCGRRVPDVDVAGRPDGC
jgi:MFS family permease